MNNKKYLVLLFISTVIIYLGSCNSESEANQADNNHLNQEVETDKDLFAFSYGVYGDTAYAILKVHLFILADGKKTPAASVDVSCDEDGCHNKKSKTDKNGFVVLAFEKGNYTIRIQKEEYGPVILKSYSADPGQYSNVRSSNDKRRRLKGF
jgi:hypothetical protein